MQTVFLRDGCFPDQRSATLADQASGEAPQLMRWQRIAPGEGQGQTVVFTDYCLEEAATSPAARKIAWLIEPPSINPASYLSLTHLHSHFDVILTHQRGVCMQYAALWYLFGGSRMPAQFRNVPAVKTGNVCIIASDKHSAPGHRLRHEVIARFPQIDAYGPLYGGAVHHSEVLPRYRYAVIIENERSEDWITEKLIDCLLAGTIPLYWGAPLANALFDTRALWYWSGLEELARLLRNAAAHRYDDLHQAIAANAMRAHRYVCAEDWITTAYPGIWG